MLNAKPEAIGPLAAAPYGSAGILPISWMYIAMMGAEGLKAATESAILAANYIAKRLSPHYPVLYSGSGGLIAHECSSTCDAMKETTRSREDVAKSDGFGFHAPTMSSGTRRDDRAHDSDRRPARPLHRRDDRDSRGTRRHRGGPHDRPTNPLKNAPHTCALGGRLGNAYSPNRPRSGVGAQGNKSCLGRRADNVDGDRNLFWSCVPIAEYAA